MKKTHKKIGLSFIICAFTFSLLGAGATSLIYSKDVTYDNTSSGLKATTVQGALDELYESAKNGGAKVSCDNNGNCTVTCKQGKPTMSDDGYSCTNKTIVACPNDKVLFYTSDSYSCIENAKKEILKSTEIVTKGDGLYKDTTIENRYIYRGKNPDNYIKLDDEMYRIISLEPNNTLKIIKNIQATFSAFDDNNTRYDNMYCNAAGFGCNVWGSKTTMLNSSEENITTMPRELGGTEYTLPTMEAASNIYLNTTWYNKLSQNVQKYIVTSIFNVGFVDYSTNNLSDTLLEESTYKWKGKIGLLNVSDYVKASTNSACKSVKEYAYYNTTSCYENSEQHNWLFAGPMNETATLLIAPFSYSDGIRIWNVEEAGNLYYFNYSRSTYKIIPVFNLATNIALTGTGSSTDPYQIQS